MRKLIVLFAALVAIFAAPVLVAGQALAASGSSPNPWNAVYPGGDQAGPLTTYCGSGQLQVQWDNNDLGPMVMQWSASLNKFRGVSSGHTILCRKSPKTINGQQYFQYAAVLNGAESNDCVSTAAKGGRGDLELHGCDTSAGYEYWIEFNNGIDPPVIIADLPNACVWAAGLNNNVQDEGTSTHNLTCDNTLKGYDWGTFTG